MLRFKLALRQYASVRTYSAIAESYEGKSVFITGGTGFLGKVLIEKLLYRCQGIDKLFLLIREKKNMSPQQRLQMMFDQPVFDRLRNEKPSALDKIIPIGGDLSQPELGIKDEDEKLLTDSVSYVFHMGATVNFRESLEVAINYNVMGTERILDLCHRMKTIKSLVYVSTGYSQTDNKIIDEVLYPSPVPLCNIRKILKDGITSDETKKLVGNRHSTYSFSKAVAESLIGEKHGNIPAIIVRPTIVTPAAEEPMKGWTDNFQAAASVTHIIANGRNRVMLSKSSNILDFIPVDYVCNHIIVAAAKCDSTSNSVAVYNCSTSSENPITFGLYRKLILADSYKNKAYDIPFPFVYYTSSKWMVSLITLIFQTLPAYIGDSILRIFGKEPRYVKIHKRVVLLRDIVEFYSSRSWVIRASKTRALAESLSPLDQKYFPFNPKDIDWKEYMPIFCKGIRKYELKNNK